MVLPQEDVHLFYLLGRHAQWADPLDGQFPSAKATVAVEVNQVGELGAEGEFGLDRRLRHLIPVETNLLD